MYAKTLLASWADMDFNAHMRNTAFLDKSADVRMMYFTEHGFPAAEFLRLKLGPVVMKDEVEYRKEVGLLQEITVTLAIAAARWTAAGSFCETKSFIRTERFAPESPVRADGWL